jgi:hypothetical protein
MQYQPFWAACHLGETTTHLALTVLAQENHPQGTVALAALKLVNDPSRLEMVDYKGIPRLMDGRQKKGFAQGFGESRSPERICHRGEAAQQAPETGTTPALHEPPGNTQPRLVAWCTLASGAAEAENSDVHSGRGRGTQHPA